MSSLFFFTGCVTMQSVKADQWQKVAVVVHTGNTMKGVEVGTTVFGNENLDYPIEGLDYDGKVMQAILPALERKPRWDLNIDGDFSSRLKQMFPDPDEVSLRENREKFTAYLKSLSQEGFDGLVLFLPAYDTQYYFDGIGFFSRSFLGIETHLYYAKGSLRFYNLNDPKGQPHAKSLLVSEKAQGIDSFEELWSDYSDVEKEMILEGVDSVIREKFAEKAEKLLR